jgi:hypothetical protein
MKLQIINSEQTLFASRIIDELINALKNNCDNDDIVNVDIKKTILTENKCEVNQVVEIIFMLGIGITTSLLADLIKKVLRHFNPGKGKLNISISIENDSYNFEIESSSSSSNEITVNINEVK